MVPDGPRKGVPMAPPHDYRADRRSSGVTTRAVLPAWMVPARAALGAYVCASTVI